MKKSVLNLVILSMVLGACSYWNEISPWAEEAAVKAEKQQKQINAFLWQATVDKIAIMPLEESNEVKGLMITKWTGLKEYPEQKFKFEVNINGGTLRADAVKVSGLTRIKEKKGWREEPVKAEMCRAIEVEILEEARILYRKSLDN